MQAAADVSRHLQLPVWVLLLAACGDDAYDNAIRKQHAQVAAAIEAKQRVDAEKAAEAEAQRAARLQDALAIESDPPAVLSEDQLHQLLVDYYCGDCHFYVPCGNCEWGGTFMNDLQEMLRARTVIPGNAAGSSLIDHMRKHRVQLPDEIPPVSEVAIELVSDFINQLPTPDAGAAGD